MIGFLARLLTASSDAALADSIPRRSRRRTAAPYPPLPCGGDRPVRRCARRDHRPRLCHTAVARFPQRKTRRAPVAAGGTPGRSLPPTNTVVHRYGRWCTRAGHDTATAVFAIVDGVLLKPLPYPESDRLVSVQAGWIAEPDLSGNIAVSPSDVAAWAAAAPQTEFARFTLGGRERRLVVGRRTPAQLPLWHGHA